jgi:hypothetical protein
MDWKTKPAPKRNIETDVLLKIRQRALDLQSELKGAWTNTEVTRCWVTAVMEVVINESAPLTFLGTRKKLEAAYAAHPTELVDAVNVVSDLVKKPAFLFTEEDFARTLFVYEANTGVSAHERAD